MQSRVLSIHYKYRLDFPSQIHNFLKTTVMSLFLLLLFSTVIKPILVYSSLPSFSKENNPQEINLAKDCFFSQHQQHCF